MQQGLCIPRIRCVTLPLSIGIPVRAGRMILRSSRTPVAPETTYPYVKSANWDQAPTQLDEITNHWRQFFAVGTAGGARGAEGGGRCSRSPRYS